MNEWVAEGVASDSTLEPQQNPEKNMPSIEKSLLTIMCDNFYHLLSAFLGSFLDPRTYLSDVNYGRSLLQNCNKRGLVLLRYVKKILERLFFTKKRQTGICTI